MSTEACNQAYITLIENKNADTSITAFLDKLEACLDGLLSKRLAISKVDSYQHVCPADIVTIISEIDVHDQVELTARNILLNAVVNSERSAAGAGIVTAITFLELSKNPTYDNNLDTITELTQVTNLKTAKQTLKRFFGVDKKIYHMILKTCELAGHNGRVHINNIPKDVSYIEVTSGYRFNCQVSKEFELASKMQQWNRSNVKAFMVDGIIESVSEIHHLLESMSEPKIPGIIFARGYSEEVIATLALNYKRGTLDIIPTVVPYDLQGMNMLKDIAIVCGSDVISSLKGELISCIDFESTPCIKEIRTSKLQINIKHDSTQGLVLRHIDDLKSRINENENEKTQLINERIKALTSNCVEISLGPEYSKNIQMNIYRFELGIRMMSEVARAGIIELKESTNTLCRDHVAHPVFSKMLESKFKCISAMAGSFGLASGIDATRLIDSIGAFIIRDH